MVQKIVDLRPKLTHSKHAPDQRPPKQKKEPLFGGTKKHAPLKTRRRRARIIWASVTVLFAIACIFGVHWISYHPRLRIDEIAVRGAILQNPDDITAFVRSVLTDGERHFIARDTIMTYPKEELRAGIVRNFPRLKSVRIGRADAFSNKLIVNVDERTAYATWCTSVSDAAARQCFVFDEGGLIFAEAERAGKPELPYAFFGAVDPQNAISSVYVPGRLQEIRDLLQRMRESRYVPISFTALDEKDFTIALSNGFTIKAAFGQPIDTIVHNLELVSVSPALQGRERDLEYIDLRFGSRVYYKFKGIDTPVDAPAETPVE